MSHNTFLKFKIWTSSPRTRTRDGRTVGMEKISGTSLKIFFKILTILNWTAQKIFMKSGRKWKASRKERAWRNNSYYLALSHSSYVMLSIIYRNKNILSTQYFKQLRDLNHHDVRVIWTACPVQGGPWDGSIYRKVLNRLQDHEKMNRLKPSRCSMVLGALNLRHEVLDYQTKLSAFKKLVVNNFKKLSFYQTGKA